MNIRSCLSAFCRPVESCKELPCLQPSALRRRPHQRALDEQPGPPPTPRLELSTDSPPTPTRLPPPQDSLSTQRSMSLARSLLGSLASRAARPSLDLRLAGPSRPSALPALLTLPPLNARRSYAVEVPPPSRTPLPADDAESLREAFPSSPAPEVRSALEEVESSEGLRRLATNEAAQDVFRRFSAYLESKGEQMASPAHLTPWNCLGFSI